MKVLLSVLTIYMIVKTISYGVFELKENKNKPAAITIICTAIGSFILTNIVIYI